MPATAERPAMFTNAARSALLIARAHNETHPKEN